ncbi:MAG: protein phosphatase CheZ, partial [Pseudomonadota bacterium]
MEDNSPLPVLRLEVNTGVFRITTAEAIYEITVKAEGASLPRVIEKIIEREVIIEKPVPVPAAASPVQEPPPLPRQDPVVQKPGIPEEAGLPSQLHIEDRFYKDVSEEMYNEIGRLARQLSLSIKTPLEATELKNVDLSKAGVDLESAKGQLQDIIKITEKATMDIMDVSEAIQDSCEVIKKNLAAIKNVNFIGKRDQTEEPSENKSSTASCAFLENLIEHELQIKAALANLPLKEAAPYPPSPEEAPATEIIKVYTFDLDVIFQTLYELCTNETVKKSHIRPMREEKNEVFDVPGILQAFSELAPSLPVEETFYNFPLSSILKILYQFSTSEKYKQTLKKMNQSAATIFIDQTIPIEGTVEDKEVPVQQRQKAVTDSVSEPLQELLGLIDANISLLQAEAERVRNTGSEPAPGEYAKIRHEDHEQLISAIESTDNVIHQIIANISRILESLSFQDLSGQRIKKILAMLSSVQVQLLSILVSFGVKLKKKQGAEEISADATEEIAHKEVDKMKSLVAEPAAEGEDWGSPLNQDAVD